MCQTVQTKMGPDQDNVSQTQWYQTLFCGTRGCQNNMDAHWVCLTNDDTDSFLRLITNKNDDTDGFLRFLN